MTRDRPPFVLRDSWRRMAERVGIEPTHRRLSGTAVLKTAGATRHPSLSVEFMPGPPDRVTRLDESYLAPGRSQARSCVIGPPAEAEMLSAGKSTDRDRPWLGHSWQTGAARYRADRSRGENRWASAWADQVQSMEGGSQFRPCLKHPLPTRQVSKYSRLPRRKGRPRCRQDFNRLQAIRLARIATPAQVR